MENTFTLKLPCKLNQDEIQEKIAELGDLSKDVARIDEAEKAYKAMHDRQRMEAREKMAAANKEIAKGIGLRDVGCIKRVNVAKGITEIVRLDTNKVVSKEPLSSADRESVAPSIPGLEAAPAALPADPDFEVVEDGQNHAEVLEGTAE